MQTIRKSNKLKSELDSKFSKSFFVFVMGFFAIIAQTLLFREFITSFASNDIAVALFFGSWFLWIAFAAWIYGKWDEISAIFAPHINILLLCYIPAFILQLFLIMQAREIAGVASYSLFPIKSMLLMAVIVNFPVSFMTGIIFPAACRWLTENNEIPVSKVYILEAVGSVSGGIAVTILLFLEINGIMIFMLSSLLITIAIAVALKPLKRKLLLIFPAILLILIVCRFDKPILYKIQEAKWSKLLPVDAYKGSFTTAQAEYLFGNYNRQWIIVRDGATCMTLPDREGAATTIAVNLCQQPQAENILIVGSGFNLCRELLKISQIKHIAWFSPDNQFISKVNKFIPSEYQINNSEVEVIKDDIRSYLDQGERKFDSVIINLSDPDVSSLNRYFTADFFGLLKQALSQNGVVGVKISGGENIMGAELSYIGASVRATLEQVFRKVIIKPGEETWFIASENDAITGNPEILSRNFAKLADVGKIFPPSGLYSLYLPGRAADAVRIYDAVDLPKEFLINRDAEPHVYLYELLLSCKQSGIDAVYWVQNILYAGMAPFIATVLAFMFVWIIYARGSQNCGQLGECNLLVLISGMLGIGTAIVLMFLYQTRYGSLYLHLGIISSLFMIGLSGGAFLARCLTIKKKISSDRLLFYTITVQIALFAIIAFYRPYEWNHFTFGMAFLLPGLCSGIYFPIAAARQEILQLQSGKSGSFLENADHLGAAIGALITGLCLIPLLGIMDTMFFFAILLLINIPIALLRTVPAPINLSQNPKNKGNSMNTKNISLKRQISFFIIGGVILGLTFVMSVKLAGGIAKEKQERKINERSTAKRQTDDKSKRSIEKLLGPPPKNKKPEEAVKTPATSNVENANLKKIRKMIKEKKLSDHEAEFYKIAE